ncbi:MAG: efflux RND transporter periplasmic adaptor subunit [Bacteroidota bacterium]
MNPSEPKISYEDHQMDRSISPAQLQRLRLRKGFLIGTSLFIFLIAIMGLRSFLRKRIDRSELKFAIVEMGIVENSFQASGKVVPSFEQNLTSPLRGRIEKVHFNVGEEVPEGASLLKLDVSESKKEYVDLLDQLAVKKLNLAQTRSLQDKNLIDLESSLEIDRLELKNLQKQLEDERYLEKIGGSTQENVQQIQNKLLIQEKELEKLSRNIQYQKAYNKTELQSEEYNLALLKRDVASMQKKFSQAEVRTQRKGVLSYINANLGNWINAGEVIAKLTDFSQFKVEAQVSTDFAEDLLPGLRAKVRINKTDLDGIVSQVSPNVEGGSIKFWIQLDSSNHELLRPNLSAEVYVIISFKENTLRVKNDAFYEGGKYATVFVVEGDKAYRREILVGASNFDYVEVLDGLSEGEHVIISDMREHETLEEVILENK